MSEAPSNAGPPARRYRWGWVLVALLFGGVMGLGIFTLAYAEGTSYLSDDPQACVNCHVMRDVYDAWTKGSHKAVATCNDCHIPHTFPEKYLVKALNGFNHSRAFTLQDFPEPIRITALNRQVTEENCLHCHADVTELINHVGQSEPEDCLRCHATVGHDQNSAGKP
jgi:cytochrome c nitrite reductase small subunit